MVINKLKNGYSLAEVIIVMMLLSLFFLVSTKVMTQKPKPKSQTDTHGTYECYYDSGLKQRLTIENEEFEAESVSKCKFETQPGVAIYNFNAIMKDGGYQNTEPNINEVFYITISSNGIITISNDIGAQKILEVNIDEEDILSYFQTIHSNSKIYNNGIAKFGLMISW